MGKASRLKREIRTVTRALKRRREREGAGHSTPARPAPSQWLAAPAGSRANLEAHDGLSGLRNALREIAEEEESWAGIPMPLEGQRLVIDPKFPRAEALMRIGLATDQEKDDDGEFAGCKIRNTFWSWSKRSDVVIFEKDGKILWGIVPGVHHFGYDLETLRSADAWSIESESNAIHTLATLVSHRQFKHYMLTGMMLETSKRSGVTYVFRRLKPTVALKADRNNKMKILCACCLHSIGYYSGSWAGAMTPTDDVIGHLMLMRGDEHMFWRRANQHPSWRPEAGL